jgi:hypothetical protein
MGHWWSAGNSGPLFEHLDCDDYEESRRTMKKEVNWRKYKVRTCLSSHECRICGKDICLGDQYYDGGYGRRAHVDCAGLPYKIKREEEGEQ